MAKSPEEMEASMIQNLKDKTGKTLEEWQRIAKASPGEKHGEIVKFLKEKHGLGHGCANLVVHKLKQPAGEPSAGGDDLVAAQYAGAKAALRPIYEAIIAAVKKFGSDVEISPKKTYVSLRRSKQFALIQPSTATRIDVGLNIKGVAPAGRLEASGSFNAMVSHRVKVGQIGEVDKELEIWLRKAFEAA